MIDVFIFKKGSMPKAHKQLNPIPHNPSFKFYQWQWQSEKSTQNS
jgi:hypothetical protein